MQRRWTEPALADLESAGTLAQWPRWTRTPPEAGRDDVRAFYRATTSINSMSFLSMSLTISPSGNPFAIARASR